MAAYLQEAQSAELRERVAQLPELAGRKIRITEVDLTAGGSRTEDVDWLDENVGWLTRKPFLLRFFEDWHQSSAGGQPIESFFAFTLSDGRRGMPRPLVWPGDDRVSSTRPWLELKTALAQVDAALGVEFGWYFHAVYGNRIAFDVLYRAAEALRTGAFALPEQDAQVLLRWRGDPYGF